MFKYNHILHCYQNVNLKIILVLKSICQTLIFDNLNQMELLTLYSIFKVKKWD